MEEEKLDLYCLSFTLMTYGTIMIADDRVLVNKSIDWTTLNTMVEMDL